MDRLGADLLGRGEDFLDRKVALRRRRAAERHGDVREARVQRGAVEVGVDGGDLDAHLARGAQDAQRDLAAVRDQDAVEHRG